MEVEIEKDRHPFRFLFKFVVFAGLLYLAGKFLADQKEKWEGIGASEARAKVEAKLSPRLGDEKAKEIAEQIINALTEKGVIQADPIVDVEETADVAE